MVLVIVFESTQERNNEKMKKISKIDVIIACTGYYYVGIIVLMKSHEREL